MTCNTGEADVAPSRPERIGCLFGFPLAHSLSPLLHQTIFQELRLPWRYEPLESTDIAAFLRLVKSPLCYGSAVTMPHKVAIMQHLDDVTEEGQDVGACNTVFFREVGNRRLLVGTNTDVVGVREAFKRSVQNLNEVVHDRPALVIGGGGAARSAVYALSKWLKSTQIYLVNRDVAEVEAVIDSCSAYAPNCHHLTSLAEAERIPTPGAIIGCIPDHPPVTTEEQNVRAIIETLLNRPQKGAMLEMAYHPRRWTALAELARGSGWQVILGTEPMIWQGLEQARLWTGVETEALPIERVQSAVASAVNATAML